MFTLQHEVSTAQQLFQCWSWQNLGRYIVCEKEAYNEDGFRVVCQEVQNPPALLKVVLRVGPQASDEVWELDAISDKEHLQKDSIL